MFQGISPLTVTPSPSSPNHHSLLPGTSGSAYGCAVLPVLGNKVHHTLDSHHLKGPSLPQLWEHFLWEGVVCPPAHSCHPGVGVGGWALLILCIPHLQAPEQHSFPQSLTQPLTSGASSLLTCFSLLGLRTSPRAWLRVRLPHPQPHPSLFLVFLFLLAPTNSFPISVSVSQSAPANQLLQAGTCRGHQPPRCSQPRPSGNYPGKSPGLRAWSLKSSLTSFP